MKSQMKVADRSGARVALIIGDDELAAGTVTVRHMRGHTVGADTGRDQQQIDRTNLLSHLRDVIT
ncbi:MAG: His/Gly/Thr/Pro-type tRNA ligase C-terminal domain-containing protein, partial [Actinomycetota bacterium]